jgi:hypothetical protein
LELGQTFFLFAGCKISTIWTTSCPSCHVEPAISHILHATPHHPETAVSGGGIGTLIVAGLTNFIWPQVRKFGSLVDARPEPEK